MVVESMVRQSSSIVLCLISAQDEVEAFHRQGFHVGETMAGSSGAERVFSYSPQIDDRFDIFHVGIDRTSIYLGTTDQRLQPPDPRRLPTGQGQEPNPVVR